MCNLLHHDRKTVFEIIMFKEFTSENFTLENYLHVPFDVRYCKTLVFTRFFELRVFEI